MNERQRRAADQLATDRDTIRRAATTIRAAPDRTGRDRLAGLDQPATTTLLAGLLDVLGARLDVVDPHVRAHVVRVARETVGDPMDAPTVRRTRRR